MIDSRAYENKRLKLNQKLRGKPSGAIITVRADKNGILLDRYWRRRVIDAETDNCVEFVETKQHKTSKEVK